MTVAADPVRARDLQAAARYLVREPLVLAEREPDAFLLIRRYEHELDRWFTRRFGYRLQVTADTARLFKTAVVAGRRPLRAATASRRPMSRREHTLLALALAAASAGATVTSLHDLIQDIRSAAVEAGVAITEEPADRRALVVALRWMIHHGAATEMHDHVDRYAADSSADAVLHIRPDRVALLPLPTLATADTVEQLLDRSDQRMSSRAWMRSMLLEEPVLYRSDLTPGEWAELRRRLREESDIFGEMFDLHIEARAEGVSAIDEDSRLTDSRFPRTGTVGHAALLLIGWLAVADAPSSAPAVSDSREARRGSGVAITQEGVAEVTRDATARLVAELAVEHSRHWSKALVNDPGRLTGEVLTLLEDHRLAEVSRDGGVVRFLPAAWRYGVTVESDESSETVDAEQVSLL